MNQLVPDGLENPICDKFSEGLIDGLLDKMENSELVKSVVASAPPAASSGAAAAGNSSAPALSASSVSGAGENAAAAAPVADPPRSRRGVGGGRGAGKRAKGRGRGGAGTSGKTGPVKKSKKFPKPKAGAKKASLVYKGPAETIDDDLKSGNFLSLLDHITVLC